MSIFNDLASWQLPPGITSRLVLVRHGEPEASARGRCYGKLDVGLSPLGRQQAEAAGQFLQRAPIAAVYSSPRQRATESAGYVASHHNLEVQTEERLSEIDFGAFEGLTYDEVAERYPEEYTKWMEHPTRVTFPGGESFATMQRRVRQAIRQIQRRHPGSTVVVVSHGGVNRIVLGTVLQMAPRSIFRIDQSYSAINIVDYYGETPIVRVMNYQVAIATGDSP